jgi:hypothetical protein
VVLLPLKRTQNTKKINDKGVDQMMNESFLQLVECLTGKKPTGPIRNYKEELDAIVNKFNTTLEISDVEKMFHSTFYDTDTIISPVPFSTFSRKAKFVYFGLNPKLDMNSTEKTRFEKELAGDTWEEYADFYTSDRVLKLVLSQRSKYVLNKISIIESLKQGKYVSWPEFKEDLSEEQIQEKAKSLLSLFMGVECIPFHSKTFNLGMSELNKLLNQVPEYACYIQKLFETIVASTENDAWIICNGANACNTFKKLVNSNESFGKLTMIKDESTTRAYSFHKWNNRKVIFWHHQLGAYGLRLTSHDNKRRMIEDAVTTFNKETQTRTQIQPRTNNEVVRTKQTNLNDSTFQEFTSSAHIAKYFDSYILKAFGKPAHRMLDISDGIAYHREEGRRMGGFAKLCSRENALVIRFGPNANNDRKLGWIRQLEIDHSCKYKNGRTKKHLNRFHNEALVYLDSIDLNDHQLLSFIKEKLIESYNIYYKLQV